MRPLLDAIADGVEQAHSEMLASLSIKDAIQKFKPEQLDLALFGTMVVAQLAGGLMVREGERGGPRLLKLARNDDDDEEEDDPFVALPWEEAVTEFKKRGRVTDQDLATLLRDVEFQTRQDRERMLQHVHQATLEKLAAAVHDDDSTFKQFAKDLRQDLVPLGVNADDDTHLRMVFRTNVQSAYSLGRDRASKDPELLEQRPYAQYLMVGDMFTRDEHREYAERNLGIYLIGSPEWELIRPPPKSSPWNCRCSWVTLTPDEARGKRPPG